MRRPTAFLIVAALGIIQLSILPGDHFISSTSAVWTTLYAGSLFLFLLLSPIVAVFTEQTALKNLWKGLFLLYIGTIGSAVLSDPGLTILLLVFSLPAVVIRLFLTQNTPENPRSEL